MSKIKKIDILFPRKKQSIYIGNNLNDFIIKIIKSENYDQIIILIDKVVKKIFNKNIKKLKKQLLAQLLTYSCCLTDKNYSSAEKIIKLLKNNYINRKSCLCVIGGGCLGDMAGFASSIYMRGIDMIYIPTTFMSQCDTIIGKVGVNLGDHKNLVGSFYSPKYTFCDFTYISSINHYQIINGLVEAWKHSILKNDSSLEGQIRKYLNISQKTELVNIISRSILIKKSFVGKDPFDLLGIHKLLSFGHTFSNYLEKNEKIKHGEGVLYGILFETFLSSELKKINNEKKNNILKMFLLFHKFINKDKEIIKMLNYKRFIDHISFDKINSHNKLNFIIPVNRKCELLANIESTTLNRVINKYIIYLRSQL